MRELAERLRALGEPTRLKILQLLHERELCVCEIAEALQMSQPRVSQHLKVLRLAGLVDERKVKCGATTPLSRKPSRNCSVSSGNLCSVR